MKKNLYFLISFLIFVTFSNGQTSSQSKDGSVRIVQLLRQENSIRRYPDALPSLLKMMNEQTTSNQEVESIVENNQSNDYEQSFSEEALTTTQSEDNSLIEEEHVSNGLENFGVEGEDAPDLFSSDSATSEPEGFLSNETSANTSEDDDLEIPEFLRRQKN